MPPGGVREVVGGERIEFSTYRVRGQASIAELPAPEPTLPSAVLTASGKKLTLSLPSTSGTPEAGQKLPTKNQLDCTHVG